MADADKNILNKIITGDGTWCFAHDRETKQQRKVVKIWNKFEIKIENKSLNWTQIQPNKTWVKQ